MNDLHRVVVAIVLVLAACGSSESTTTESTVTGSTETTGSPGTTTDSTGTTTGSTEKSSGVGEDQELVWGSAGVWRFGEVRTIEVNASSGLEVALSASGACSVESSVLQTVLATGVGDCVVSASQAGSAQWNAVSESRVFEVDRAQAVLESFTDSFEYDGDPNCRTYAGAETCRRHQLVAETTVPVVFTLGPAAGESCEVDGDRFWITNNQALPRTCPILVTGQDTDTQLGFEETRTVTVRPFPVEISLTVAESATGFIVEVMTNESAVESGCGRPSKPISGSVSVAIPTTDVPAGGCAYQVDTLATDGSLSQECRRVNLPDATVASC